jgi:hypothetical protein
MRHRSDEYSDSLSYRVNPLFESSSHSYGVAVQVEVPETLHLGRALGFRHSRSSARKWQADLQTPTGIYGSSSQP